MENSEAHVFWTHGGSGRRPTEAVRNMRPANAHLIDIVAIYRPRGTGLPAVGSPHTVRYDFSDTDRKLRRTERRFSESKTANGECRPGWRLPPQQQQETFDEALGSDDRDGNTGDNGLSVVGAGRRTCATAPHRRTVAASAQRDGSVSPRNRCPRHARRDHAGRSAAPASMARMATRATGGRT